MEVEGRRRRRDDAVADVSGITVTEGNDRAGFIEIPNRGRLSTYIAQVSDVFTLSFVGDSYEIQMFVLRLL